MAAAEALTLPTGETFVFSEWGDFPTWSRVEFEPGVTQDILAFNYTEAQPIPGGSSAAPATHYDTNMEEASQLPIDEVMIVMSIQIRFDESDSDNDEPGKIVLADSTANGLLKWRQLLEASTVTFTITNQKPMAEGPIDCFPFGGGLYFQHSFDSDATDYAYNAQNGFPTAEAARLLALPLRINTLQPFKARYRFPRGSLPDIAEESPTEIDDVYGLTMFLYGPRQRPVG